MFDREPISHTGITDNYQFECQDSDFEFVGQGCHLPIRIWITGWTVARILEIVTIHMRQLASLLKKITTGVIHPTGCPKKSYPSEIYIRTTRSKIVKTVQNGPNGPNGPKWSKRSKMV